MHENDPTYRTSTSSRSARALHATAPLLLAGLVLAACGSQSEALVDADGDGFFRNPPEGSDLPADCDDDPRARGASVFPGAQEVCNGLDDDCDGEVDEADALGTLEYWPDNDGDGFGVFVEEPTYACVAPPGFSTNRRDCNDGDIEIYPSAPERCNNRDDDCDLEIDEGIDKAVEWFADLDGDGYGKERVASGCPTEPGLVRNDLDCSDISDRINPDADEVCDGIDNDCDGDIDDADDTVIGARIYYADVDDDGYGDILAPVLSCDVPSNAVENSLDCDDDDNGQNPDTIWYLDADWDGHGNPDVTYPIPRCEPPIGYVRVPDDCDDSDPREFDNKAWYADADRDGFGFPTPVAVGCDPFPEWVDNTLDCNDRDPAIRPGADEVCDTVDNDCNGAIDDADEGVLGQSVWYADRDNDGAGRFYDTQLACFKPDGYAPIKGDCNDDDPTIDESPEWHLDDDRDGFGDPATPYSGPNTCERVPGHVPNDDDCNDDDYFESPRVPWFPDQDGDGVGAGHVPAVRACINPDPDAFAGEGGDCDDDDPSNDGGGCYGDPRGLAGLVIDLDNDTEGLRIRLECAGVAVIDVTFDAVDAGLTVEPEAEVQAGALCVPLITQPPSGDASNDGGPVLSLVNCGDVQAPSTPFIQAVACQGCTDPGALNYDPDALVSQDVCTFY